MRKVLVTGADGFIGSHLVELLVNNNYDVRALSLYNSFNNWGWLEKVECLDRIEVITGDIRDINVCNEICTGVDAVFHLAALIAIPYSYKAPDSYIDTNIKGTSNICSAAKSNNVKKIVHTSTSEVYGTAQFVPITEEHPLQPQSPYSASKIAADAMAMSYYNAFNLPVTVARPFNTYGPRQSARAVIPSIITQLAAGKELHLGDLSPTRDFTFVKDTCKGLLSLMESDDTEGEVFNIGSNFEISIGETLKIILELMSESTSAIRDEQRIRPENSEVFRLWCDNKKLIDKTGFKPDYDLRSGLKETIDWFTNPENLQSYKSDIYNV